MDEQEQQALETLRNLTLQLMLISAGVFGIVGGFITASDKAFTATLSLMTALIAFSLSGLCGYLVHGFIIGILGMKQKFSPHNIAVQLCTLLQILLFIGGSLFFVFFVFCNVTPAAAQSVYSALDNPYVQAVDDVLDQWDAGELRVTTEEIRPAFVASIERRADQPVYTFEAAPNFADTRLTSFAAFGEAIEAELPLSIGARLMLLGAVADRVDSLEKELTAPNEFLERFEMETMVTLGASQMAAREADRDSIDSGAVITGLSQYRSMVYPFCCWNNYR